MVTLKLQFAEPLILDALQFTGVVPVAKVDPEAGVQLISGAGLPVAEGVQVATALSHWVMFAGQTIPGAALVSPASNSPSDVSPVTELDVAVIVLPVVVAHAEG